MEGEPKRSRSEIFAETSQDMEALFARHNARVEAAHQRLVDTANGVSSRVEAVTDKSSVDQQNER